MNKAHEGGEGLVVFGSQEDAGLSAQILGGDEIGVGAVAEPPAEDAADDVGDFGIRAQELSALEGLRRDLDEAALVIGVYSFRRSAERISLYI